MPIVIAVVLHLAPDVSRSADVSSVVKVTLSPLLFRLP
jgi:hypothetical protein